MAKSPLPNPNTYSRFFTIAVEGNIGSGKTTFLNHVENLPDVSVVSEPIEMWQNCNGHNLLSLMYQDPKKWSFTFQSYVQLTMLSNHLKTTKTPIKLMERSIFSARYCFVEKMYRDKILDPPAFSVVDEWFKWICQNNNVTVDLFVYLRTSPEVVYERIINRNRHEEKSVSFDYIKSLHDMHEDWLYNKSSKNCMAPVFTIDANIDLSVIQDEYGKFESEILSKKNVSVGI